MIALNIHLELPKETIVISRHDLKGELKELLKELRDESRNDAIMTIQDVAEYLKVSVPTVRAMIAEKDIPFFQRGQVIRLKRTDINEWLRSNMNR